MDADRYVLPRWRASIDGALSPEAGSPVDLQAADPEYRRSFEDYLDDFHRNPSRGTVSDLLAAGLVFHRLDEVAELAGQVKEDHYQLPLGGKIVAQAILERIATSPGLDVVPTYDTPDSIARLRVLRTALKRDPRNALAWIDSALVYTVLGQIPQASRAVEAAVDLAPESRFVIRAATRFFIHAKEPERACALLEGTGQLDRDPWLAAASIGASLAANLPPLRERRVTRLLESVPLEHRTELLSSLATAQLIEGNDRRALRNFRQSLVAPTENTLAQAEWVTHRNALLVVDERLLYDVQFPFEAQARHLEATGNGESALAAASLWMDFQPFSSEAAAYASYIASVGLGDFEMAARFAERRIKAGDEPPWLLNNLAFALANMDRAEEAAALLRRLPPDEVASEPHLLATSGLVAYRRGNAVDGRVAYSQAMRLARRTLTTRSQALMAIFWAREESRQSDRITDPFDEARHLAEATQHPFVVRWLAAGELQDPRRHDDTDARDGLQP